MPRRAYPSHTLAAAVRAQFGRTQAELAAFIGVSRSHLAMHEAGRKTLGPGPDQRLQVLARQGQVGPKALVESELDGHLVDVQTPTVQDLLDQVAAHRLTLTS